YPGPGVGPGVVLQGHGAFGGEPDPIGLLHGVAGLGAHPPHPGVRGHPEEEAHLRQARQVAEGGEGVAGHARVGPEGHGLLLPVVGEAQVALPPRRLLWGDEAPAPDLLLGPGEVHGGGVHAHCPAPSTTTARGVPWATSATRTTALVPSGTEKRSA